jgi:aldehyde dehydrogenase (NAD+)
MIMENQYKPLVDKQKKYFKTGSTRPVSFRVDMLRKLKQAILSHENEITEALYKDLGKSEAEVVSTEIGFTLNEINHVMKKLPKWAKRTKKRTNLFNLLGKSYIIHEPYGTTLIIGPWNYPFQLVMSPLVGAITGGNTAVVKPSEISTHTAQVIDNLLSQTFEPSYIAPVQGGIPETNVLLDNRFDKIFFTGSPKVGSIIMEKAAKHLTPVVLELGGKSPTVIDKTAKLDIAAKRIVFGKGTNAGQTCVAPDYVLVHESRKDDFYKAFENTVKEFYNHNVIESESFGKMINVANYQRMKDYMNDGKIVCGGQTDDKKLKIGLTLVEVTDLEKRIMQEEIFGPVLPVVSFKNEDQLIEIIHKNPDPLAMYIFSEDKTFINRLIHTIPFGGGCINDTIMHLTNENLPFGGRGTSGMGNYHGIHSFNAFTHQKAILQAPTWFDLKLKYPPFMKKSLKFVKWFMYGKVG